MACFQSHGGPAQVVQPTFVCEIEGETNPLVSKRVIDTPNPPTIANFIAAAETRVGATLLPIIEWQPTSGSSFSIESDETLVELIGRKGCFRFHRNEAPAAPVSATSVAVAVAEQAPITFVPPARPNSLQLVVNGKQILVRDPQPSVLLVDFLRDNLRLTGTKIGCGEGGCGACTVMVKPLNSSEAAVPINSCLRLLCACDGLEITTVEGLGSEATGFSEVQKAIADGNGSQCGFCTPGWVVNMSALLAANPTPTPQEVEQHFDGNICRCTGYRPILEAFQKLAAEETSPELNIECRLDLNHCGDMEDIAGMEESKCCSSKKGKAVKKAGRGCCKTKTIGQDIPTVETLHYTDPLTRNEYWRPSTLTQLLSLVNALQTSPSPLPKTVQIVCGNTGMGVGKYYQPEAFNYGQPAESDNVLVDIKGVPEIMAVSSGDAGLTVGAGCTVADLITYLESNFEGSVVYSGVVRHLKRVANTQVRSAASWAGNIALLAGNPTFSSDIGVVFGALGVTLQVADPSNPEASPVNIAVEDWVNQRGGGLIVSGLFPALSDDDYMFYSDKTGQRHVNSHAITNAGFLYKLDSSASILSARCCYGGLLQGFVRMTSLESSLVGGTMGSEATLQQALTQLDSIIQAAGGASPDPQNSEKYRLALARSFLYKSFLTFASKNGELPYDLMTASRPFAAAEDRKVSRGSQVFTVGDPSTSPVGKYVTKLSARIQASGEAKYTSDLGSKSCLYATFVLAEESLVLLDSIDANVALTFPGVTAVITAADVPGKNRYQGRECVFVDFDTPSPYIGAPVALVVADTLKRSRAAAKRVVVNWKKARPDQVAPLADVEGDGVEWEEFAKSALSQRIKIRREEADGKKIMGATVETGDVEAAFARAPANGCQVTGGRLHLSGQKHFFLETHTTLAVPDEDRRILVNTATQYGQYSQQMLSTILGLPAHRIEVKTRRVGGAYGGKITQNVNTAAAACVAALKLGQPVLMHNERQDEMVMLGGREAMEVSYHVAFSDGSTGDAGHIQALDMFYAMDGAFDATHSLGSLSMATTWSDGCYYVPDFRSKGMCRHSARPPNTSCRAPGNMQSISVREFINEHVAKKLGIPHMVVQERNMYQVGQTTPFGDVIGENGYNWTIPELWRRTKAAVGYEARAASVAAFNAANRFRKRGLCLVPTKYGFSPSEYKVGCLVNIFATDGTVEVFHSGSELGQGINTKVAQAVAMQLQIPIESVVIGDNTTAVVPNAGCTGGSGTSEACVGAAILACKELMTRLDSYLAGAEWADAVSAASGAGVGLTYAGWFNVSSQADGTFEYATQGVGFSEVEIDCLTGEVQVLRCDLHMDQGYSLNPAVDIGQIEGGFIMALGYMLTEEVLFSAPKREGVALDQHAPNQSQVNVGTWFYKPPSALDIPEVLNITLMPNAPNPAANAVVSSKGSGEPPMALACAVTLAIKQAIYAARESLYGITDHLELDLPLSVERIQSACLAQDALHMT